MPDAAYLPAALAAARERNRRSYARRVRGMMLVPIEADEIGLETMLCDAGLLDRGDHDRAAIGAALQSLVTNLIEASRGM